MIELLGFCYVECPVGWLERLHIDSDIPLFPSVSYVSAASDGRCGEVCWSVICMYPSRWFGHQRAHGSVHTRRPHTARGAPRPPSEHTSSSGAAVHGNGAAGEHGARDAASGSKRRISAERWFGDCHEYC